MDKLNSLEHLEIESGNDLRSWLSDNHARQDSIWVVTYKKNLPEKYVSTAQILDELLCFGWIDGIRRKVDDHRTKQLISPRKSQHWARTYKERVERLRREGRMHSSGEACIMRSKELGLWNFMDDVDKLIVPKDLEEKLIESVEGKAFFDSLNPSSKRFALRWLKLAKTDKTRNKRIQEIVQRSAKGEKIPGS